MVQPTGGTDIDEGLEPVPQYRFPESVPITDEKQLAPQQKSPPAAVSGTTGERTIFGMRRPTFFLILLLILVIIIAAVAGGVGGSVAVSKAYDRGKADAAAEGLAGGSAGGATTIGDDDNGDSDDKPTSTSSSRVQPPPTEGVLALDCPDLTDTIQALKLGDTTYKFRVTCGVNHAKGGGAEDMIVIPAYSFNDCITACASFNELGGIDKTCVMAHFNANIMTETGGNCWLKSKVGDIQVNENDKTKNLQVEAELLDD